LHRAREGERGRERGREKNATQVTTGACDGMHVFRKDGDAQMLGESIEHLKEVCLGSPHKIASPFIYKKEI